MTRPFRNIFPLFFSICFACLISACSNSDGVDNANYDEIIINSEEYWNTKVDHPSLDDREYPYAGIPRIVIETVNHQEIRDRETEVPAKLQIWGENAPESEVMNLTIRGRGNSSWKEMPKKSYKLEFTNKQGILGMPKDRDWALIANYADKTLMKNYLIYHLAAKFGTYYAPRCEFAELYLNKEYLGVYLLTETIKFSKNRIAIPKTENSYIVEFDVKYKEDETVIFPSILNRYKPFHIHFPKTISDTSADKLTSHIQRFEQFLKNTQYATFKDIEEWLDIESFEIHFWIQEFSKNPDANYFTSVYFTWVENGKIQMGPVWDFDIAFGGHYEKNVISYDNWRTKYSYWGEYLFANKEFERNVNSFWIKNHDIFDNSLATIDSLEKKLNDAAENNFKRWDILQKDGKWISKSVKNYNEAVCNLKNWIKNRIQWIDENIY